jgi:ribonuclease P protein component
MRTREFEHVYRGGRRRRSQRLVVIGRRSPVRETRFGISVRASLGGAATRNRIKRRLREALRERRAQLPRGWDIVVEPRTAEVATMDFALLQQELEGLLAEALEEMPA